MITITNLKTNLVAMMILLSGGMSFGQTAIEYFEAIGTEYTAISEASWKYTQAASHNKSGRKINKRRKQLIKTNLAAQKTIKGLKVFNGSAAYKDSVLEYLSMSHSVMVNDYAKIMDLEEITEQSYDQMEAFLLAKKTASDKLEAASDMVGREQKRFCASNNINLLEDNSELGEKMEAAGLVYDYYNPVYLIFFKASVQESKMIIALSAKDINATEQSKQSMKVYAEEGLAKLAALKSFKGDNSLISACKQMLTFYVNEAEKDMPIMIDFLLTSEKFAKYDKAFQAKKKRTQEDIDKYNGKVDYLINFGLFFLSRDVNISS
jgi:hypothetical protein